MLAGCDFLPSIPGIGIMTAYSLVSKYRNIERVSYNLNTSIRCKKIMISDSLKEISSI